MTAKGSTPGVIRFASLLAAAALVGLLPAASAAASPLATASASASSERKGESGAHVRVRGFARIDAHFALASGKLVISGTVTDDAGRAAPGAEVVVGVGQGSRGGSALSLGASLPESCRDASRLPVLDGPERLRLPADASGRFCIRLSLPKDRYVANLEVGASGSLDGSRLEMQLDLSTKPVTLRFDPERYVLSLDEDTTNLEVVASTEEDGVTTAATGLGLDLTNEAGAVLGRATTNASGRARFAVFSAHLGQPGKGELRTSFAGSAELGPSSYSIPVERHARVDLVVPDLIEGRRPLGSPEDGIVVPVVAMTRCAHLGCGGFPTGSLEARVGDMTVGAATLDRGEARMVVSFALTAAAEVPLRLRYAPDAPWFRPTGDLVLAQPLKGQSPWKKLPLALAGLGAVAWLTAARLPRRRPRRADRSSAHPPRQAGAHVELVRGEAASRGWSGRVIDADEGGPVGGARVSIERRGFERTDVIARATSDAQGVFALDPVDALPGDELVADGQLHALLRGSLPPTGELRVALVLRRRALLDRLVAWAHRQGRPFNIHTDPTPAQIRRAAAAEIDVVRWASAVERAAYGGGVVDEQAQREVDRLAPGEAPDARAAAEEGPRATPKRRRP
jgi:hypothetical protein